MTPQEAEIGRLKERLGYAEGFEKEIFGILGMPWYPGCKCHLGAQDRVREAVEFMRNRSGPAGCPTGMPGEEGPAGMP